MSDDHLQVQQQPAGSSSPLTEQPTTASASAPDNLLLHPDPLLPLPDAIVPSATESVPIVAPSDNAPTSAAGVVEDASASSTANPSQAASGAAPLSEQVVQVADGSSSVAGVTAQQDASIASPLLDSTMSKEHSALSVPVPTSDALPSAPLEAAPASVVANDADSLQQASQVTADTPSEAPAAHTQGAADADHDMDQPKQEPPKSVQPLVKVEDAVTAPLAAAASPVTSTPAGRPSAASVNAIFAPTVKRTTARKSGSVDPSSTVTSAAPQDIIADMRAKIHLEPRDADAWLQLLQEVHQRADSGSAGSAEDALKALEDTYEDFFKIFPNAGAQWVKYGQLQLSYDRSAQVESIFTRSLRTTPDVELWRFYLSYTRRVNPLPPATAKTAQQQEGETPRERTRKLLEGAYEFALRFIGTDMQAGPIWTEYLQLLKEREVGTPWQEGQKMDDLRRTFQRAVTIPLDNVEQIWREYDAYENGLSRVTAKKFLAERSPAYMTARSAVREQRNLVEKLVIPALPHLPCWVPSAVNCDEEGAATKPRQSVVEAERDQVSQWLKYIEWEKKNPLELEETSLVHARVLIAFRKATSHARFYPEIWFLASEYSREIGDSAEATQWMRSGMQACPGSFLLHFAFVDRCEASKEYSECQPTFDSLLSHVHERITRRLTARDESLIKIDAQTAAERERLLAAKADEGAADELMGDEKEGLRNDLLERQARKELLVKQAEEEVQGIKEEAAVVWIKQMQFERRTQGLKAMRTVFGRARKSAHCAWPVYEASAMLEYHCSKDANVATKVFELALKTFSTSAPLVERYLSFLISINDENNARALFERTIGTFTPESARGIWARWLEYTYDFGDLVAAQRLETRLQAMYPDVAPTVRFAQKARYKTLDVVSTRDLGILPPSSMQADVSVSLDSANGSASVSAGPTGNEDPSQPAAKRPRVGQSPAPNATIAPRIPLGPSKGGDTKGGNTAKAPEPRPPVPMPPTAKQAAPSPAIPDRIMWLLSILPPNRVFQGPKITPEGIFECLAHANLHAVGGQGAVHGSGPVGSYNHGSMGGAAAGAGGMYGGGPGGYGMQQQHGMNGGVQGGFGGRKRKW